MQRVVLNIGGDEFVTTRTTLMRYSDSFFSKLVDGALSAPADGTPIFVDRDGTNFRYILNFLRDGSLPLTTISAHVQMELLREAEFYQLTELKAALLQADPLGGSDESSSSSSSSAGGAPSAAEAPLPTKVLQVLPSMGAVTAYALAWEANRQTIAQCHTLQVQTRPVASLTEPITGHALPRHLLASSLACIFAVRS
mmetsp:Transcript_56431/g.112033  ORF Transcript_56431/g.112033 Transcript_56431/m.112033 type:complete len:197 (-) Transcript_56431:492-1082(-)